MSSAVLPPSAPNEEWPRRYKWTVTEFTRAWDMGLFPEDARLELIDGEIIEQMRPKPPHVTLTSPLLIW